MVKKISCMLICFLFAACCSTRTGADEQILKYQRQIDEYDNQIKNAYTNASGVNMFLPFKLIKNESSGLISNVTTKGLEIIIDKKQTNVHSDGDGAIPKIDDFLRN